MLVFRDYVNSIVYRRRKQRIPFVIVWLRLISWIILRLRNQRGSIQPLRLKIVLQSRPFLNARCLRVSLLRYQRILISLVQSYYLRLIFQLIITVEVLKFWLLAKVYIHLFFLEVFVCAFEYLAKKFLIDVDQGFIKLYRRFSGFLFI